MSGSSLLAAVLASVLLPQAPGAPAQPGRDGGVERRFDASWSHRAVENRIVIDGRVQPVVPLTGSVFDVEARRRRVFVDRPVRRDDDGALLAFERRIVTATEDRRHTGVQYEREQRLGDYYPIPVRAESAFERALVRWSRDSAGAAFSPELVERGDPERLGELEPDGALLAWRPPEARLGARWTLPAAKLLEVRGPGGRLGMDDDAPSARQGPVDVAALWEAAMAGLEGELECEVHSMREEAGGRRLVARIAGEIRASSDWDERPTRERSGRLDVRLELTGELVWDLDRDLATRLALGGPSEVRVATTTEREVGAGRRAMTITTALVGEWSVEASATPLE